jgi:hypothetical protein
MPRLRGGAGWFYVKFGPLAKLVSTLAEGAKSVIFLVSDISTGRDREV